MSPKGPVSADHVGGQGDRRTRAKALGRTKGGDSRSEQVQGEEGEGGTAEAGGCRRRLGPAKQGWDLGIGLKKNGQACVLLDQLP